MSDLDAPCIDLPVDNRLASVTIPQEQQQDIQQCVRFASSVPAKIDDAECISEELTLTLSDDERMLQAAEEKRKALEEIIAHFESRLDAVEVIAELDKGLCGQVQKAEIQRRYIDDLVVQIANRVESMLFGGARCADTVNRSTRTTGDLHETEADLIGIQDASAGALQPLASRIPAERNQAPNTSDAERKAEIAQALQSVAGFCLTSPAGSADAVRQGKVQAALIDASTSLAQAGLTRTAPAILQEQLASIQQEYADHVRALERLAASKENGVQAEQSLTVNFSPGKLELGWRRRDGTVTAVFQGQAQEQGVNVGMRMTRIGGQQFSAELLEAKTSGTEDYEVEFILPVIDEAQAGLTRTAPPILQEQLASIQQEFADEVRAMERLAASVEKGAQAQRDAKVAQMDAKVELEAMKLRATRAEEELVSKMGDWLLEKQEVQQQFQAFEEDMGYQRQEAEAARVQARQAQMKVDELLPELQSLETRANQALHEQLQISEVWREEKQGLLQEIQTLEAQLSESEICRQEKPGMLQEIQTMLQEIQTLEAKLFEAEHRYSQGCGSWLQEKQHMLQQIQSLEQHIVKKPDSQDALAEAGETGNEAWSNLVASCKQEAEAAKEDARQAQIEVASCKQQAEAAKEDVRQAQLEVASWKQEAEAAQETARQAQMEVASCKQEAEAAQESARQAQMEAREVEQREQRSREACAQEKEGLSQDIQVLQQRLIENSNEIFVATCKQEAEAAKEEARQAHMQVEILRANLQTMETRAHCAEQRLVQSSEAWLQARKDMDRQIQEAKLKELEQNSRLRVEPVQVKDFEELVEDLKGLDGEQRWKAVATMSTLSREVVVVLLHLLQKDFDPDIRRGAADALGYFGETTLRIVHSLREVAEIEEHDPVIRGSALRALSCFGETAASVAGPVLQLLLRKGDGHVRHRAAEALGNLGGHIAEQAVSELQELLLNGDDDDRRYASEGLRGLGEQAASAVPALLEAVFREHVDHIARNIVKTLGGMNSDIAGKTCLMFQQALDNDDFRIKSASLLGYLGEHAKPAVPKLIQLLGETFPMLDEDAEMVSYAMKCRRTIVETLGRLGVTAAQGVPALKAALTDDDHVLRELAAQALLRVEVGTRGR